MMRDDKLIELFEFYSKSGWGCGGAKWPDDAYAVLLDLTNRDNTGDLLVFVKNHAAWMAAQAIDFVKEAQKIEDLPLSALETERIDARYKARSKREKAHRWLGFIQGVLWLSGVYTLDELKEHSHKCSDDYNEADAKDDVAAMDEDARRER